MGMQKSSTSRVGMVLRRGNYDGKERHVSRCSKRSSLWRKGYQSVARLHRLVFDQRNDFQPKVSRAFVNRYGFIAVEDLQVKGLAGGMLAKSVQDASWALFIRKLLYKAASADRQLAEGQPA
jgi:putative transposase